MSFAQAAAIPQAAILARQGLCDKRPLQPGQTVLINGAGGGVGTFAIQMAKTFGADVTGVDRTDKLEMMRALGADHVIDYTQEDFTQSGRRYDLILDVVARRSVAEYRRTLSPTGILVLVGGSPAIILQTVTLGTWFSLTGRQKLGLLMHKPNKDLAAIIELFEAGSVVPVIDSEYPLHEAPDALRRLGDGDVQGKVIVSVSAS
jgi:NADPH:quinone reductase-like Zn-dependent oxidoreductase